MRLEGSDGGEEKRDDQEFRGREAGVGVDGVAAAFEGGSKSR